MSAPQPDYDALYQWRNPREGCQHQLACKCQTPYYLRAPTKAEAAREERMLNLRVAANAAIQAVNVNIDATFYASTGFTIDPNTRKQVPSYAAGVPVLIQAQAVAAGELKHLEEMNVQGVLRSVHLYGNAQGVVRPNQQGGDLLYFKDVPTGTLRVWKIVKVAETWPLWSHVIVNMQPDAAPPP